MELQIKNNESHQKLSAMELAQKWNLGLGTASNTMNATTQKDVRTSKEPISERVRVYHLDLYCKTKGDLVCG